MRRNKRNSEVKKVEEKTVVKEQPEQIFEIVKNGHCFELHKITPKGVQKLFIKADTNLKDFTKESNKYRL